ncbi:hypothetical protein JOB18_040913 [Solea senegalensis]|uniref:Uncharacterized protein n=1 Tax=Solea senegalensis TaxID=28829 RepID=A0AAV6SMR3_SOLSE|nr:hypothetical protein JOB18_040913 [Solea senegalensis]
MKCDIVFHPMTTTMSRCRNMPFVKRCGRTSPAPLMAFVDQPSIKPPNNTRVTLENQASIPSIDLLLTMRRIPHPPLARVVLARKPTGQHNSEGRHSKRPC